MIIRACFAEFGGALDTVAENARSRWDSRRGLVLSLEDEAGTCGQGEASPLPAYSRDTLAMCRDALAGLDNFALGDLNTVSLTQFLRSGSASIPETCPAARHALETALLDLLSRKRGIPAWQLLANAELGTIDVPSVAVANLLPVPSLGHSVLENAIGAALSRGIRSFKLKLGSASFSQELEALQRVRHLIGSSCALRLDVNRAWTFDEALARLPLLAAFEPEFVEEPVAYPDVLRLPLSLVPIALDETLQLHDPDCAKLRSLGVAVLVLKPMALGGIARCLELWRRAKDAELKVVISHLFDGPIAFASAAALSLVVQTPGTAAGLDQHAGLRAWSGEVTESLAPALSGSKLVAWREAGFGLPLLKVPNQ